MRIDCERSPRLRVRLRSVNVCVIVGLSDREERRGKEGKERRRKALLTAQHHVSRKQGSCMMEEMMRTHALRRIIFHDGYFVLRVPLSSLGSWGAERYAYILNAVGHACARSVIYRPCEGGVYANGERDLSL